MPSELLDGQLRVETGDGYVRVWHARSAESVAELEGVLEAIDQELDAAGLNTLLFDSREANYSEGEVQKRMWGWLSGHPTVKRVATVMKSEMLAISVNMRGMSEGVKIKAFADEESAAVWLRG